MKRPILTVADARALEEQADDASVRRHRDRPRARASDAARVSYRDQKTRPILVFGTTEYFGEGTRIPMLLAGVSSAARRSSTAATSPCSATRAYQLLFADQGIDPIGKIVRIGTESVHRSSACSTSGRRPATSASNQDDFVVIPYTTLPARLRASRRRRVRAA